MADISRTDRLKENFSFDYVDEMGVAEICLILKGGKDDKDFPKEWNKAKNMARAIEEYNEDPNLSFFKRKYAEMGKPMPED